MGYNSYTLSFFFTLKKAKGLSKELCQNIYCNIECKNEIKTILADINGYFF